MMKFLYFGTRDTMLQITPPDVNYGNTRKGYNDRIDFINGGLAVKRSVATHKEYNFSWTMKRSADVRPIGDFYGGVYGPGPFYFLVPGETEQNVVPLQWSSPAQGSFDAPLLVGAKAPTVAATAINSLGYSSLTASYTTGTKRKLYIPIPPGFKAWVGVHGPSTSVGKVQVQGAISRTNLAAPVAIAPLAVSDPVRVNTSFSGNLFAGIEISLQDNTTYTGLMVQILADGETPAEGGFISGQGHSGCEFLEAPMQSPYSAALDRVGMTATLGEVVDWL